MQQCWQQRPRDRGTAAALVQQLQEVGGEGLQEAGGEGPLRTVQGGNKCERSS